MPLTSLPEKKPQLPSVNEKKTSQNEKMTRRDSKEKIDAPRFGDSSEMSEKESRDHLSSPSSMKNSGNSVSGRNKNANQGLLGNLTPTPVTPNSQIFDSNRYFFFCFRTSEKILFYFLTP